MKLLILAGPSGGHLFPALAFAEYFRNSHRGAQFGFVVTPRISPYLKAGLLSTDAAIFYLPDFPFFGLFSLKAPLFLLKSAQAFLKTKDILNQMKPDAVVAFGSFVSIPGVILGHFKKIPTVLHEQNVLLGRANRMLIPFATKVAVSFPGTLEKLPREKGVWVGNILRPEMMAAARRPVRKEEKTQILIVGGSQGASLLNRIVLQSFKLFTAEEKQKIAVIHITGASDFPEFEHAYDNLGIANGVFPFTDEMPALYAGAQLAIARAGAGTVAELALFGIPSILIPYPHAGSHQLANARSLAERNAASLMEEKSLEPQGLKRQILSLLSDPKRRALMGENARSLAKPDAGEQLAEEVDRILDKEREVVS